MTPEHGSSSTNTCCTNATQYTLLSDPLSLLLNVHFFQTPRHWFVTQDFLLIILKYYTQSDKTLRTSSGLFLETLDSFLHSHRRHCKTW